MRSTGDLVPIVLPEPGDPNSVRLTWLGGLCDERAIVSVPGVNAISVATEPGDGPCRAAGVYRSVILTFDEPVDLPADGG